MANATALTAFVDKETRQRYAAGDPYESSADRVEELCGKGLVAPKQAEEAAKEGQVTGQPKRKTRRRKKLTDQE